MPLPSTAELLVGGGDPRIAPDPLTGRNPYGCRPLPEAGMLAFGSSTSSTISAGALAAAEALRARLASDLTEREAAPLYRRELDTLRREFMRLCGYESWQESGQASGQAPGQAPEHQPGLIFGASGTDVHLLAARVAACADTSPVNPGDTSTLPPLAIIAGDEESGSGVRAALGGRHFSAATAMGCAVTPGEAIDQAGAGVGNHATGYEVANVPIRQADGMPRGAEQVDREVEALVTRAVAQGRRVLLVLIDVSKTGCIAPSVSCVTRLHRRWPVALRVLVDACQFRLRSATVRAYVERGFLVALTGSKFLTGPSFSGALLVPPGLAGALRTATLPAALRRYSAREEWPADWPCAQALPSRANFGLLLRWQAAIHEWRAFHALAPAQVGAIARRFAEAVQRRLRRDGAFGPLSVPALDRVALGRVPALDDLGRIDGAEPAWDGIQTIHPFLLFRISPGGQRVALEREATSALYRRLQRPQAGRAHGYQLGQPVPCGHLGGVPVSALRLCLSARLIVRAAQQGDGGDAIIRDAMACLDAIAAELVPSTGDTAHNTAQNTASLAPGEPAW